MKRKTNKQRARDKQRKADKQHKIIIFYFLMFFFTTTIIFIGGEILTRYHYYKLNLNTLLNAQKMGKLGGSPLAKKRRSTKNVGLNSIIKINANDKIIYDLIPNITAKYCSKPISINSMGFRDKDYPIIKPANTVRIVGIGDSVMFGQAINQGTNALSLLEKGLNKIEDKVNWEIINMSVPGYNTANEVETLKEKGLQFSPDAVILTFVENDYCLPSFIRKPINYLSYRKSFLFEYIKSKNNMLIENFKVNKATWQKLLITEAFQMCTEADTPEMYHDMIGLESVIRNLNELSKMSKQNNFEVILFFYAESKNPRTKHVRKEAKRLGFYIVDASTEVQNFMNINNIKKEDIAKSILTVQGDGHPSELSQGIFAQTLYRNLKASGLINKLAVDAINR